MFGIRVSIGIVRSSRDLAVFDLPIDSKLRACDLVKLRLDGICSGAKPLKDGFRQVQTAIVLCAKWFFLGFP